MATAKTYNSIDSKEQLMLVVAREGTLGGYKQNFLVKPLNELETEFFVCTECRGVMRNACQVGEEQIHVCETCVGERTGCQPMIKARQKIPELKVKCPLTTRGCPWNATLFEVDGHLDKCQEFLVKCEYDCGVIFKRRELNNHCRNECLNRNVSCEHCQNEIVYRDLKQHYKGCLEFPLVCPNNCGTSLRRKQTYPHIETDCPNTIVKCRYERFGCKEELKRCEMTQHNKANEIKHLEMSTFFAVDKIERLEEANTKQFSQFMSIIESVTYPIVLREQFKERYLEFRTIFSHHAMGKFEISWRFINLQLSFENKWKKSIFTISVVMEYNKVMSPLAKWPFEGRFKLTLIDKTNANSSLVYETLVVKLQPQQIPEYGFKLKEQHPSMLEIASFPTKLLSEDRFRKESGEIEFTLQIQEAEHTRMQAQMTALNKNKDDNEAV